MASPFLDESPLFYPSQVDNQISEEKINMNYSELLRQLNIESDSLKLKKLLYTMSENITQFDSKILNSLQKELDLIQTYGTELNQLAEYLSVSEKASVNTENYHISTFGQ